MARIGQIASDAYQAAIDRLQDKDFRSALTGFRQDHQRRSEELSDQLSMMGGTPPKEGDMRSLLAKGKVCAGRADGRQGDSSGDEDQ
jgi:hypothetical protein